MLVAGPQQIGRESETGGDLLVPKYIIGQIDH